MLTWPQGVSVVLPRETLWLSVLTASFAPAGSHEEGLVPRRQTDAKVC